MDKKMKYFKSGEELSDFLNAKIKEYERLTGSPINMKESKSEKDNSKQNSKWIYESGKFIKK